MAGFEELLNDYLPTPEVQKEKEEKPGKKGKGENNSPVSKKSPHGLGLKRLKRRPAEETFDLHGYTAREAEEEFKEIIKECKKRKLRKALIIHGKGVHSPDGSILQPLVWRLLDKEPSVMEHGYADYQNGGNGATWFILRG